LKSELECFCRFTFDRWNSYLGFAIWIPVGYLKIANVLIKTYFVFPLGIALINLVLTLSSRSAISVFTPFDMSAASLSLVSLLTGDFLLMDQWVCMNVTGDVIALIMLAAFG
jgi:hypothetical protein